MRIETILQRYLPEGGRVLDSRPEPQRARMSFAADTSIEVRGGQPDGGDASVVVVDAAGLPGRPVVDRGLTVVTIPGDATAVAPLVDVLTWAGEADGQVVEITRLLAPAATAVVVRHGGPAEVPAIPGRSEPLAASQETWKRLAGELLLERHRTAVRDGEVDRLTAEVERLTADVAKLKRALRRARRAGEPQRRRLRLPWSRRRSGGEAA